MKNPSGGPPISHTHQPVYLKTLVYPDIYQFLTKKYPKGDFRFIEPNEQLVTVILESSNEIIGILDHLNIFHGVYNLATNRVKLLNMQNEDGMVFHINRISNNECAEFPDGYQHRFLELIN